MKNPNMRSPLNNSIDIYIYRERERVKEREREREMICPWHFHNIFTTNLKWKVVTGCYCWDKKVILVSGLNLNQWQLIIYDLL